MAGLESSSYNQRSTHQWRQIFRTLYPIWHFATKIAKIAGRNWPNRNRGRCTKLRLESRMFGIMETNKNCSITPSNIRRRECAQTRTEMNTPNTTHLQKFLPRPHSRIAKHQIGQKVWSMSLPTWGSGRNLKRESNFWTRQGTWNDSRKKGGGRMSAHVRCGLQYGVV